MALLGTTLGEPVSLDNRTRNNRCRWRHRHDQDRAGNDEASLADLNAKVVEIAGDVATIETDLGELRVDLSKQTSVTAGIASGETKVTVDSTPTWIAAVMAVIAAVSAIGSMVILVRKLA